MTSAQPSGTPKRKSTLLDPRVDVLVPRATGLLLCVTAVGPDGVDIVRFALSALFFLVMVGQPRLLRNGTIWIVVGLGLMVWNWSMWRTLDNHIHLISYWTFGLGLALLADDVEDALRTNARLMVGLAFGFAVLWKAISPDYPSGAFFHFELLTDPRFVFMADHAAGLDPELAASNRQMLDALVRDPVVVTLHDGSRTSMVAAFLTWWTIGIEAVLALLYLLPLRFVRPWMQHGCLAVFCVSTYSLVPVTGFASAILAISTATPTTDKGRRSYLFGFLFLLLYSAVFHSVRNL